MLVILVELQLKLTTIQRVISVFVVQFQNSQEHANKKVDKRQTLMIQRTIFLCGGKLDHPYCASPPTAFRKYKETNIASRRSTLLAASSVIPASQKPSSSCFTTITTDNSKRSQIRSRMKIEEGKHLWHRFQRKPYIIPGISIRVASAATTMLC